MNLIYENVDITRSVAINKCEHETFAEDHADTLLLRFSDAAGNWNAWRPRRGDLLRIVDEEANTGDMYVSSIIAENGLFTLRATSMPITGDNVNSQSWENVRLHQLAGDIAKRHNIALSIYDSEDRLYPFIKQERQSDFEFLNALCKLEGYAVVLFNKSLIIYDEHKRESTQATTSIRIGADGRFAFADESAAAYGTIVLSSGAFEGRFNDSTADASRVLRTKTPLPCSSGAEAQRFARGLLRQANKNTLAGSFRKKLTRDVAAASVISITVEKAPSWDGKVFVTRTRNDFVRGETKVFFRKPLEGY